MRGRAIDAARCANEKTRKRLTCGFLFSFRFAAELDQQRTYLSQRSVTELSRLAHCQLSAATEQLLDTEGEEGSKAEVEGLFTWLVLQE